MKRALRIALCLVMGLALPAAARPTTDPALMLLNGVPVKLGTITTTGASTTNATTASAFTVTGGSSSSTTYTNAAFGTVMSAGVPRYFILRDADTTVAVAAAASVNCAVHVMR